MKKICKYFFLPFHPTPLQVYFSIIYFMIIVVFLARLPCFGLDIGGSLVKLVYFEPCNLQINRNGQDKVGLEAIQDFIKSNVNYGETGARDERLAMENVVLGGRKGHLHFIRFSTDVVGKFLLLAEELNASVLNDKVCATGGGAFKFEKDFKEVCLCFQLDITFYCFSRGLGNESWSLISVKNTFPEEKLFFFSPIFSRSNISLIKLSVLINQCCFNFPSQP